MTETSKAVFLSYASQDAGAARPICDALRAAGIEVWFDQSELRGGDVWDQTIRRQIRDCALFLPLISNQDVYKRQLPTYLDRITLSYMFYDDSTHVGAKLIAPPANSRN